MLDDCDRCKSACAGVFIEYDIEVEGGPPEVVGMLVGAIEVLVYGPPGKPVLAGV